MKEGEDITRSKAITPALALLAAVITFAVFLPALQNGFVNWDDQLYVYKNPNIRALNIETLKWAFTAEVNAQWYPLTMLSFALDYSVWGLNPLGYHLTNNIFHAANTFLVFIITWRLFDYGGRASAPAAPSGGVIDRGQLVAASVTAILFGLHPLHVESVAWVTERKDVLYAFFFLLSIIMYLRYAANPASKPPSCALSLLFFALSLMSKPMAVTLPFVLLILDFYPLQRLRLDGGLSGAKRLVIEKVPFFALSAFIAALTFWMHKKNPLAAFESHPFATLIGVPLRGYLFYLYKTIWPFDLAPLYPYPINVKTELLSFEYLGYMALLLGITVFSVIMAKTKKIFLAVWLYYVVTLLPVIGFVQAGIQAAADRFTYLPGLGPFILAGAGVGFLIERFNKQWRLASIVLPAGVVIAVLASLTVKQISVWKDSVTLWSYEIDLYPEKAHTAYYNRGLAYLYLTEMNSTLVEGGYDNRGAVYGNIRDLEKAISDFSEAVRMKPDFADALYNRGVVYGIIGDSEKAIGDFNEAVRLKPDFAEAYNYRGVVYGRLGNSEKAISDFSEAVRMKPDYAGAYNNRGAVYGSIGDSEKAISDFSEAVRMKPDFAAAHYNLSEAYSSIGDTEAALKHYKEAARLGYNGRWAK